MEQNFETQTQQEKVGEDLSSYNPKKVRFIKNIVQLIIGIILLFMANQYLNEHPAERASMVSGINIIYQKVKVMFYNLVSTNSGKLLDEQYAVERNYTELIKLAQESDCATGTDKQDIEAKLNEITSVDVSTYGKKRLEYNNFAVTYYKKLKTDCTK